MLRDLRARVLLASVIAATVLAGGCLTSNRFVAAEKLFTRGDFAAAAAAYDSYLETGRSSKTPTVLLHLALMYADRDGGIYDQERSVGLLEELRDDYPGSPEALHATVLIEHASEVLRLTRLFQEEQSYARSMTAKITGLEAQVAELSGRLEGGAEQASALEEKIEQLTSQVRGLNDSLSQRQEQIVELEATVERMRSVALQSPP